MCFIVDKLIKLVIEYFRVQVIYSLRSNFLVQVGFKIMYLDIVYI
jgi:hypothetical protein